jgi:hypothetical protein
MLLIDSVVIIRYVMIFCLKNPGALEDRFWNVFSNLWIYLMSTISQIVYLSSPGHWNINFYICSGLSPYKVNSVLRPEIAPIPIIEISKKNFTVVNFISIWENNQPLPVQ